MLLFFTLVILIAEFVVILPISLFFPQMLFGLGVSLNNPSLIADANYALQPYVGLTLNFVFLAFAIGLALFSLKTFTKIQRFIWILYFIVFAVLVGFFS